MKCVSTLRLSVLAHSNVKKTPLLLILEYTPMEAYIQILCSISEKFLLPLNPTHCTIKTAFFFFTWLNSWLEHLKAE